MDNTAMEIPNHAKTRLFLQDRLDNLDKRLTAVRKDLQKGHSKDWEEQAQERENDEVLEALQSELVNELVHIREALMRIENGTYGICAACGAEIDASRLAIVPDALHCIKCAE